MTTIKMNDGRSEYDVTEDYYYVERKIKAAEKANESFIEATSSTEGKILIHIANILSVKWGSKYEK